MNRIGRALLAALLLQAAWAVSACQASGEPSQTAADATTPGAADSTSGSGTVDLRADVSCDDNASCRAGVCDCDDGFTRAPSGACIATEACWFVACGAHSTCDAGECLCDAGFEAASSCHISPPGLAGGGCHGRASRGGRRFDATPGFGASSSCQVFMSGPVGYELTM